MAAAAPIITLVTSNTVAGILTRFALSLAVSFITQKLFAPDVPSGGGASEVAQAPDQGVKQRIATDPANKLPIVYGEAKLFGTITYADISSDNQTMAFIVSMCEGPVERFGLYYWDDYTLTLDGSGNVIDAIDTSGESDDFLNDNLKIIPFSSGGRCAPMESFSSNWSNNSANRTMPDVAYLYIELKYNRDKGVTGLSTKLGAQVFGRTVRLLSGISNTNTIPTATGFSDNPADCLLDYLTNNVYGCGFKDSEIDFAGLNSQKFYTNQIVPFRDNNNNTTSGKIYTTNGVVNTNDTRDLVLSDLTVNQGCIFGWEFGKFKIRTDSAFLDPITQLDDADLYGDITIVNDGFNSQINKFNISYNSKAQNYQDDQVFTEVPSTRKTFNEPDLLQETRLKFCNNAVEAKRLAAVVLNTSRNNLVVSFTCDSSKIQLALLDVISLTNTTYGFINKQFRINSVTETEISDNGIAGFLYTAKEYSALDYTLDGTIQAEDTAPNTNLPNPRSFGLITDLTSISSNATSSSPFIELQWTVPNGLTESFEVWTGVGPGDPNTNEIFRSTISYNSIFSNTNGAFIPNTLITHRVYNLDFVDNLVFWVRPINQFAKGLFSNFYEFGEFRPAGIPLVVNTDCGVITVDGLTPTSVLNRFVQVQYADDESGTGLRGTYNANQAIQEISYTGDTINTAVRQGGSDGTGTVTFPANFDPGTPENEVQTLSFDGTRVNVGSGTELLNINLADGSSNSEIRDTAETIRDFGPVGFINTTPANNEALVNNIVDLGAQVTGEISSGSSSLYTYKTHSYIARIPQNYISVYNNDDLDTELFRVPLERPGFDRVVPMDNDANSIIGNVVDDESMICYKRTTSDVGAFVIEIYNLDFVNNGATYNSSITPSYDFTQTTYFNQNGGQISDLSGANRNRINWATTPIGVTKVTDSSGNARLFAAAGMIRISLLTVNHASFGDTSFPAGQQYIADATNINTLTWSATTTASEQMSSQYASQFSFGTGGLPNGSRGIRVLGDIVVWAPEAIGINQTTGNLNHIEYKRWNNTTDAWDELNIHTYNDTRGGGRTVGLGQNTSNDGLCFSHFGGDSLSNRMDTLYFWYRTSDTLPTLAQATVITGTTPGTNRINANNSTATSDNFLFIDTDGSTSGVVNARIYSYNNAGTITDIFNSVPLTAPINISSARLANNTTIFERIGSSPQDYNYYTVDTTADTLVFDGTSIGPAGANGLGAGTTEFGTYAQIFENVAYVSSSNNVYSFETLDNGSTWTHLNTVSNTDVLLNAGDNLVTYNQGTQTIRYYDKDLNFLTHLTTDIFDITNNIVEANENYMAWYNGDYVRAYFFNEQRFQDVAQLAGIISLKIKDDNTVTVSTSDNVQELVLFRPAVPNTYELTLNEDYQPQFGINNHQFFSQTDRFIITQRDGANTEDFGFIDIFELDGVTLVQTIQLENGGSAFGNAFDIRFHRLSGSGNWLYVGRQLNSGTNYEYMNEAFYYSNAARNQQWLEVAEYIAATTVLRQEDDGTWSTYTSRFVTRDDPKGNTSVGWVRDTINETVSWQRIGLGTTIETVRANQQSMFRIQMYERPIDGACIGVWTQVDPASTRGRQVEIATNATITPLNKEAGTSQVTANGESTVIGTQTGVALWASQSGNNQSTFHVDGDFTIPPNSILNNMRTIGTLYQQTYNVYGNKEVVPTFSSNISPISWQGFNYNTYSLTSGYYSFGEISTDNMFGDRNFVFFKELGQDWNILQPTGSGIGNYDSVNTIIDSDMNDVLNNANIPFNGQKLQHATTNSDNITAIWLTNSSQTVDNGSCTINYWNTGIQNITRIRVTNILSGIFSIQALTSIYIGGMPSTVNGSYTLSLGRGEPDIVGANGDTVAITANVIATTVSALTNWSATSSGQVVTISYLADNLIETQNITSTVDNLPRSNSDIESVYIGEGFWSVRPIIDNFPMNPGQQNMHVIADDTILVIPRTLPAVNVYNDMVKSESKVFFKNSVNNTQQTIQIYDFNGNLETTLLPPADINDIRQLRVSGTGNWIYTLGIRSSDSNFAWTVWYLSDNDLTPQFLEGTSYSSGDIRLFNDNGTWGKYTSTANSNISLPNVANWTRADTNGDVIYQVKNTTYELQSAARESIDAINVGELPDGSLSFVFWSNGLHPDANGRYREGNCQITDSESYTGSNQIAALPSHRGSRESNLATRTGTFIWENSRDPATSATYTAGLITNPVTALSLPGTTRTSNDGFPELRNVKGTGGYINFCQLGNTNGDYYANVFYNYNNFDGTNGITSLSTTGWYRGSVDVDRFHYSHLAGGKDFMLYSTTTAGVTTWSINKADTSGDFSTITNLPFDNDILNSANIQPNAQGTSIDAAGNFSTSAEINYLLFITDEDRINNEFTINAINGADFAWRRYRVTSTSVTQITTTSFPGFIASEPSIFIDSGGNNYEIDTILTERGDVYGYLGAYSINNNVYGFNRDAPAVGEGIRWTAGSNTTITIGLGSLGTLNNFLIPEGSNAIQTLRLIRTELLSMFPSLTVSIPRSVNDIAPNDPSNNTFGFGIEIDLGVNQDEPTFVRVDDIANDGEVDSNRINITETNGTGDTDSTIITIVSPYGNQVFEFSFVTRTTSDNNVQLIGDTVAAAINASTEVPYNYDVTFDATLKQWTFTSTDVFNTIPGELWTGSANHGAIDPSLSGNIIFGAQEIASSNFDIFSSLNYTFTQIVDESLIPTFGDEFSPAGQTTIRTPGRPAYSNGFDHYIWHRQDAVDSGNGGWIISRANVRTTDAFVQTSDVITLTTSPNQITILNPSRVYPRSLIVTGASGGLQPLQIDFTTQTGNLLTINFTDTVGDLWSSGSRLRVLGGRDWASLNALADPQNANLFDSNNNWRIRDGGENGIGSTTGFNAGAEPYPGVSSGGIVTANSTDVKDATLVTTGVENVSLSTFTTLDSIKQPLTTFDGSNIKDTELTAKHLFTPTITNGSEAAIEWAAEFNSYWNTFGSQSAIITNFTGDFSVFNGTYEEVLAQADIPTFTGDFDPDSTANATLVPGTIVYRMFSNSDQRYYYLWNRFDSTVSNGGWHISGEAVTDMGNTAGVDTGVTVASYATGTPNSTVTTGTAHNLQIGDQVSNTLTGTFTPILSIPSSISFEVISTNSFIPGSNVFVLRPAIRNLPWAFLATSATPQDEPAFNTTGWHTVDAGVTAPPSAGQFRLTTAISSEINTRSPYLIAIVDAIDPNIVNITSFIQDDIGLRFLETPVNTTNPIITAFNEGTFGTIVGSQIPTIMTCTYPDGTIAYENRQLLGYSPPARGRVNNAEEAIELLDLNIVDWLIEKDIPSADKIRFTSNSNIYENRPFMLVFNHQGSNGDFITNPVSAALISLGGSIPTYYGLRSRQLGEQNIISTDPADYCFFPININTLGSLLPTYKVERAQVPEFRFDYIENGIPAVDRLDGFFLVPSSNIIDTLVLTAEEIYDLPIIRPQDNNNVLNGSRLTFVSGNFYIALNINDTNFDALTSTLNTSDTGATVYAEEELTDGTNTYPAGSIVRWNGTGWTLVVSP